jgi:hypothetical protein
MLPGCLGGKLRVSCRLLGYSVLLCETPVIAAFELASNLLAERGCC